MTLTSPWGEDDNNLNLLTILKEISSETKLTVKVHLSMPKYFEAFQFSVRIELISLNKNNNPPGITIP